MLAGGIRHLTNTGLDFGQVEALTFDCYGTLIDWETGILAGLRRSLAGLAVMPSDDDLLERYSRAEATLEAGPYQPYRDVLAASLRVVCGGRRRPPPAAGGAARRGAGGGGRGG